MSRKEGVLEFVPPRFSLDDVGGYAVLKTWLQKRQTLFSREALDAGIPIPQGDPAHGDLRAAARASASRRSRRSGTCRSSAST